jgi:hypothetical protein
VELAQLKYLLPRWWCRAGALAPRRRHRHEGPRRNQARDRPPADPGPHPCRQHDIERVRQRRAQLRERRQKASVPPWRWWATPTPARHSVQRADLRAPRRRMRCSSPSIPSFGRFACPTRRASRLRHRRFHRSPPACAGGGVPCDA